MSQKNIYILSLKLKWIIVMVAIASFTTLLHYIISFKEHVNTETRVEKRNRLKIYIYNSSTKIV